MQIKINLCHPIGQSTSHSISSPCFTCVLNFDLLIIAIGISPTFICFVNVQQKLISTCFHIILVSIFMIENFENDLDSCLSQCNKFNNVFDEVKQKLQKVDIYIILAFFNRVFVVFNFFFLITGAEKGSFPTQRVGQANIYPRRRFTTF